MKAIEYAVIVVLVLACVLLGVPVIRGPQASRDGAPPASGERLPTQPSAAIPPPKADTINPPSSDSDVKSPVPVDERRLKTAREAWSAFLASAEANAADAQQKSIRAGTANHPALIEDYKKGLAHQSALVRKAAVTALMLLHTPEAGETLVAAFATEADSEVQLAILAGLGHYCGDARAIETLQSAVTSPSRDVAFAAITTLAQKAEIEMATEFMRKRLATENTRVGRSPVIVSLGILAERGSLPAADELVGVFRTTTDPDERKGVHKRLVKAGRVSMLSDADLRLLEEGK